MSTIYRRFYEMYSRNYKTYEWYVHSSSFYVTVVKVEIIKLTSSMYIVPHFCREIHYYLINVEEAGYMILKMRLKNERKHQ